MQTVTERDWMAVSAEFETTSRRYVVLDNFLTSAAAEVVHQELLQHWGWRKKNWVSGHLHNAQPRIMTCARIAEEFLTAASPIVGNLKVCDYWALLYANNTKGNVHADAGKLTLTIWLTPECHNLAPDTGGLLLFDVSRHPSQMLCEYLIPPASTEYVRSHTSGKHTRISYRWNRAVLFDATTFHRTDDLHFDTDVGIHAARMNLTFAIDHLAEYHDQFQQEASVEKRNPQSSRPVAANKANKSQ